MCFLLSNGSTRLDRNTKLESKVIQYAGNLNRDIELRRDALIRCDGSKERDKRFEFVAEMMLDYTRNLYRRRRLIYRLFRRRRYAG